MQDVSAQEGPVYTVLSVKVENHFKEKQKIHAYLKYGFKQSPCMCGLGFFSINLLICKGSLNIILL